MQKKNSMKKQYKLEYDKEHYNFISLKLKKSEEFKNNLKAENIGITDFFKKCIKNYKEI